MKLCMLSLFLFCCAAGDGIARPYSALWGKGGEEWSPQSRLPDFSFAGYHSGEKVIPEIPVVASVRDYGAVGDGRHDDTQAFIDAIEAVDAGAIDIPAGRYVLTDRIRIEKGGIVLRGAGPDQSVLVIPKSLLQVIPPDTSRGRAPAEHYSFGPAFFDIRGRDNGQKITEVTRPALRGDRVLVCADVGVVKAGDMVRLLMQGGSSLGRYLHDGQDAGEDTLRRNIRVDWAARVVRVAGNEIEVDRPLRVDVRMEWQPEIYGFEPSVEELGIEGLSFEFPGVPKKKHLVEEGFNAIQMTGVVNCWVRNVRIVDADMGIKLTARTRFCHIEGMEFVAAKREGRTTGHHAIWIAGNSQENMVIDFRVATPYVHDLSLEGFAYGNVFRKGSGVMLNLDHHRNGPYENLFTDIDAGSGRRLWNSGGSSNRGPHSAVRTTVWNIRHAGEDLDQAPDWPQINIVGVVGYEAEKTLNARWIEPLLDPPVPADLYEAQVRLRTRDK
ncbi:MAG: glycosyl hydrolase family 28-related protein [bacterium]|nr:glycosyl hydrolase family 28-related protein [bacterium]